MKLYRAWLNLSEDDKKKLIRENGKGLDWKKAQDNLEVFKAFINEVQRAHINGRVRIGAFMIINYLRWETTVEGGDDMFKVNNNIAPIFARLTMRIFKDTDGMFELRGEN